MVKISLSSTNFQINDVVLQFPIDIADLKKLLGDCRYKKYQYNHIYTWDDYGIIAYSNEGIKSDNITLELQSRNYDFSAKNHFTGELIFDSQKLFDYYEINKNRLIKLFKGDKNGAFVLNGISIWLDQENGKITALEISPYEEITKEPKIQLKVAEKFKIFESLWQEWVEEITKLVPTDNDYYNLTDGITEEDINKHSELEQDILMPPALQNFYKIHNVEYDAVTSAFQFLINNWSYELIPFKDIKEEWESIQDLQFDEDDLPERKIDFEKLKSDNYTNPKWIPFATGRNGNYLLYDTDPAEKGKFGQILELQNESWERNIVAKSLEELLKNEINNLKTGKLSHFDFIVGKEILD